MTVCCRFSGEKINKGMSQRNNPSVCHNCGKEGHVSRACTNPSVCNYCKKTGHIKWECPNSRRQQDRLRLQQSMPEPETDSRNERVAIRVTPASTITGGQVSAALERKTRAQHQGAHQSHQGIHQVSADVSIGEEFRRLIGNSEGFLALQK